MLNKLLQHVQLDPSELATLLLNVTFTWYCKVHHNLLPMLGSAGLPWLIGRTVEG